MCKYSQCFVFFQFGVQNRTCVIQNVQILCPRDGHIDTNYKHINDHKDVDPKKLTAYAQGLFSANCRGPYHRETLFKSLYNSALKGEAQFNECFENFLNGAGICLTDNPRSALPVYDMSKVFDKDYVSYQKYSAG